MRPQANGQVTSVTGTANQVAASPSTGNVVLTLPNIVKIPTGATSGSALTVPAGTTSASSFHMTTGGVAPTTPSGGDMWISNAILTLYANTLAQNILTDGANVLAATQIPVVSGAAENQLITEGPTIDGSSNISSVGNITGSGTATFTALATAPGAGAGVGSIQFFTTGSTPSISVTVTPATAPTSNFTLSLPNTGANDTLASLASVQTLSSKTLSDALFVDGANGSATLFSTLGVATAVNNWQIGNSATGNPVQVSAVGADNNITAAIAAKGAAPVYLDSNGAIALAATNNSTSAVNYPIVVGSAAGTGVAYAAQGADPLINVALVPKGSGAVVIASPVRTNTASSTDFAGFIAMAGGTGSHSLSASATYTTAPVCVATDTTANASVRASATTSALTVTGTTTDVIAYICVARN